MMVVMMMMMMIVMMMFGAAGGVRIAGDSTSPGAASVVFLSWTR